MARVKPQTYKRKTAEKYFKRRDKKRAIQWRAIKAQLKQSN